MARDMQISNLEVQAELPAERLTAAETVCGQTRAIVLPGITFSEGF